ncbi:MAG: DNA helicase RecQ [Bacteroidales bacterium]|nr:DNA helicase RecQ [Bacteroidales bacterium]MCK9448937.1 DNA helicase RecQ [Bacteroidales bacterium]MDD3701100.1 DNA helicase RecQ [Bacteroidales bacterium]MDY0368547.1 DNA helicase RecQ [Bacteroidales bacterium]
MVKKDEYGLHELLKKIFGFDQFKGNQEAIIRSVLERKNTFVVMPTGGGKSLCYQLPALMNEGTAIIVSPLIALMKNQVDTIRNFGTQNGVAHVMNSSLSRLELQQVREDLIAKKTKLLYVAPESLTKDETVEFLRTLKISFVAIDEAHCISEWGHDFRPEYRRLRPIIDAIDNTLPVIALTATATLKVQQDILKNLEITDAVVYKASFDRPNLYYEVRPKTKDVVKDIIKYIKANPAKSGIVYCLSRRKVEELAETLVVNGIRALPYHAGLDSSTRTQNQDMFLMEEVEVIVATIAFGMGIDKPDIRFVIHHDIPKSIEGYYQETGRAGRDDGEGNCIAFYSYDDILKLEKFMKDKPVAEQEIAKELLNETVTYAESAVCRHKLLLHYFGESYPHDNCGACDNCLNPKEKFDGQEEMKLVLETVMSVKQLFKSKHIAELLVGKLTGDIKNVKHDTNEFFGAGDEENEKFWNAVIRQALIHKLLVKDIENYGILKITKEGKEFIKKPHSIMLVRETNFDDSEDDEFDDAKAAGMKGSGTDTTLFAMLKDLRKAISKKENLPPFIIFQDPSLEDMAIQYPVKMDELTQIIGVGQGKAAKYGEPFLKLIRQYVEENDITRPNDMVVKSVINKSGLKVYIIQNIDRKLSLEDIAYAKNLSFDELLTELESIVASGTRIDISYYIDEFVDEYHQQDIFDYFSEAESDSIETALETLGEPEYTEEEIRLMRIKFMSDVGN